MTPEEFIAKLEEMRTIIADKLVELEEDPDSWTQEERDQVINALDELTAQMESLSEALQSQVAGGPGGDD
jgi:hypothetical protein